MTNRFRLIGSNNISMRNIELKARYANLDRAREIAQRLESKFERSYHQVDTYFQVHQGRLKLREFDDGDPQLIFYSRADQSQAKVSEYHIYPVTDAPLLTRMLRAALGVWAIVEKWRDLYWYDEVRIHLDRVSHLGSFLEFEGVVGRDVQPHDVQKKVAWLTEQFRIEDGDLIDRSYSDLICDRQTLKNNSP